MKIVYTTTYEVERMTVKEYMADHQYRQFLLAAGDVPSCYSSNIAYLETLRPSRKLYIVNSSTDDYKIVRR